MPELGNNRREQFARARSKRLKLVECQNQAGYSPNTGSASALAKVPEVAARIEELKEMNKQNRFLKERERRKILHGDGDPNEITRRWVQAELYENLRLAREAGIFNAANKVLEMLAKSLNLFDPPYRRSMGEVLNQDDAEFVRIDVERSFETLNGVDSRINANQEV